MKKLSNQEIISQLYALYMLQSEKVKSELTFCEWVCVNEEWLVSERERKANQSRLQKIGSKSFAKSF